MSEKLKGIAAAPGIAIAPLVHFHGTLDYIPTWNVRPDGVASEQTRFGEAVAGVVQSIQELRQELVGDLSKHEVQIYDAQVSILHDPTFQKDVTEEIAQHQVNAEVALQKVVSRYEGVFEAMADPSMRERAADLRDVGRQLIAALMERERSKYMANGRDYLFAAEEFLPSDAGVLDREHLLGIITAQGGKYSHGAILARSLGIPAVVGVEDVLGKTASGIQVVLDGDTGVAIIDPSPEELAHYQVRLREQQGVESRINEVRFQTAVTLDGDEVKLFANVEGVRDLDVLEAGTISGIGLFRTEFAFMERKQFPTEDEQVKMYRQAMEGSQGKPVTFRVLDVGGDKPLGYFRTPDERNPVLGWRGLRICLDWPDILFTQLRAILRASSLGHARILLPMVTTKAEVERCRAVVDQLLQDLRATGEAHDANIELGIMVEVPVMVSILPDVLPLVDFVSVGTNDLVQYLLAVDRDNSRVAKMYDPFHPGVLRVLEQIASAAKDAGKPASVCGEIAGDHYFTPLLIGFGFRELSMAPVFVPRVKLTLRRFSKEECETLAERAKVMDSTQAIRQMLTEEVRVRWSRFLEKDAESSQTSCEDSGE